MISDAILNLVDSILTLVLVPLILLKARDRKVGRSLATWLFSVSLWSFGVAMHGLSRANASALFWSRFLHFGAVPLPVLYLYFTLTFLGISRPWLLRCIAALAALFICLIPTRLFIREVSSISTLEKP